MGELDDLRGVPPGNRSERPLPPQGQWHPPNRGHADEGDGGPAPPVLLAEVVDQGDDPLHKQAIGHDDGRRHYGGGVPEGLGDVLQDRGLAGHGRPGDDQEPRASLAGRPDSAVDGGVVAIGDGHRASLCLAIFSRMACLTKSALFIARPEATSWSIRSFSLGVTRELTGMVVDVMWTFVYICSINICLQQ